MKRSIAADPIVTCLNGAAVLAAMLGLAMFSWSVRLMPPWTAPSPQLQSLSAPSPKPALARDINDYAAIWKRDLRAPLADAPPAAAPVSEPPPFQLIGTLVGGDGPVAVFTANQAAHVKRIGEDLNGWCVSDIQRGRVRIQRGEREVDLRVPWYEQIARDTGARP